MSSNLIRGERDLPNWFQIERYQPLYNLPDYRLYLELWARFHYLDLDIDQDAHPSKFFIEAQNRNRASFFSAVEVDPCSMYKKVFLEELTPFERCKVDEYAFGKSLRFLSPINSQNTDSGTATVSEIDKSDIFHNYLKVSNWKTREELDATFNWKKWKSSKEKALRHTKDMSFDQMEEDQHGKALLAYFDHIDGILPRDELLSWEVECEESAEVSRVSSLKFDAYLKFDPGTRDEQIIEDFKKYLKKFRKRHPSEHTLTGIGLEKALNNVRKYKLIPYIDLTIWMQIEKQRIYNQTLSLILFRGDRKREGNPESITKGPKKHFEYLTSRGFLLSCDSMLREQLDKYDLDLIREHFSKKK